MNKSLKKWIDLIPGFLFVPAVVLSLHFRAKQDTKRNNFQWWEWIRQTKNCRNSERMTKERSPEVKINRWTEKSSVINTRVIIKSTQTYAPINTFCTFRIGFIASSVSFLFPFFPVIYCHPSNPLQMGGGAVYWVSEVIQLEQTRTILQESPDSSQWGLRMDGSPSSWWRRGLLGCLLHQSLWLSVSVLRSWSWSSCWFGNAGGSGTSV